MTILYAALGAFAVYTILVVLPILVHPHMILDDLRDAVYPAVVYIGGAIVGAAIAIAITGGSL